jgi:hypothetical protein
MNDQYRTIDRIETAIQNEPFCACGQPSTIVARDGALRLECPTVSAPRGSLGRLLSLVLAPAHLSQVVIDGELAGLAA